MDFGRLPVEALDAINFTLPPDPSFNESVLKGERKGKVYVGLPQWGKVEWVGKLYRHKLKPAEYLDSYVHHYSTVEVNATHYTYYGKARISAWADKAKGLDFKFCPKMHKDITHAGPLAPRDLDVEKFLDEMQYFGDKLGPIFAQVPDRYDSKKKNDLFHFFDSLPEGMAFFMEVRHPSWFQSEDLFRELSDRKLGAMITDTAGARYCAHMHLTIPKVFIRFVTNNLHPSDFSRIDEWAVRINEWLDKGIEAVYFILHEEDPDNIIDISQHLITRFNEVCKLSIPPLILP